MDTLFLVLLLGLVLAIAMNGGQQPGPPSYMYIPVEVPQPQKSGCLPAILIMLAVFIFGLLITGQ